MLKHFFRVINVVTHSELGGDRGAPVLWRENSYLDVIYAVMHPHQTMCLSRVLVTGMLTARSSTPCERSQPFETHCFRSVEHHLGWTFAKKLSEADIDIDDDVFVLLLESRFNCLNLMYYIFWHDGKVLGTTVLE